METVGIVISITGIGLGVCIYVCGWIQLHGRRHERDIEWDVAQKELLKKRRSDGLR